MRRSALPQPCPPATFAKHCKQRVFLFSINRSSRLGQPVNDNVLLAGLSDDRSYTQVKQKGPGRRLVFLVFSKAVEQTVLQEEQTLLRSLVAEGWGHRGSAFGFASQ